MRRNHTKAVQPSTCAVTAADITTKEEKISKGYVHYADRKTKEELIYESYTQYCVNVGVRPASFDTWMALQESLWPR